MSRLKERIERVRAVLRAGENLRQDERMIARLVESTGLSREGVQHALLHQLEREVHEDLLLSFVMRSGAEVSSVHVVLASTVFTAPLRAIAWAVAKSERVTIAPSRRDPVFAEALVRALDTDIVRLASRERVESDPSEEVHVYGSDRAIAEIRERLAKRSRIIGHGTGFGVAWIGANAHLAEAAEQLAEDVIPFDQRGCLSPRIVFVEGPVERSHAFMQEAAASLERWEARVPRGPLRDGEAGEIEHYVRTMQFAGVVQRGEGYVVGVGPILLPPTGRCVHIATIVASASEISKGTIRVEGIDALSDYATVVGYAGTYTRSLECFAGARHVPLGTMQRPPFDGPVDLRLRDV